MKRSRVVIGAALLSGLTLLVSCGGDGAGGGGGPITGPKAQPGELTVSLASPNTDDRAILVSITGPGPISAITAGTDYLVLSQITSGKAGVAVFGSLVNGPLIRFSVPDVGAVASYAASITEAVDPANNPRAIAGYSLTIAK